ncbi:MAG: hypothetical protein H0W73_15160 [Bacteroidetes bacterium]|nr:hypothetical protein [Bacteroidota bacterium]
MLAFIGIIGLEISSHSVSLHKKTEVITGKKDLAKGPELIFEEERDIDDHFDTTFLSPVCFLYDHTSIQLSIDLFTPFIKTKKGLIFKSLLFISHRSLRL